MFRASLQKCVSSAAFICLCAGTVPAQEPEMIPPPVPEVMPAEPPDPDTLPPPPALAWEALPPRDPGGQAAMTDPVILAEPQPEAALVPPPNPTIETALPGEPDPAEAELAKPEVEIWREGSETPQIPARRFNRLDQAFIAGTDPVALRIQFNPLAAGKSVLVRAGRGVTIVPANAVLTVSESGECIVSAQLHESFPRSHIIFYCDGIKTVLPVARASVQVVEEAEGGG